MKKKQITPSSYEARIIRKGLRQGLEYKDIINSTTKEITINNINYIRDRMRDFKWYKDEDGDKCYKCPCCKNFKKYNNDNFRKKNGRLDTTCKECWMVRRRNDLIINGREREREKTRRYVQRNKIKVKLRRYSTRIRYRIREFIELPLRN